jgi:ribosomal protein L39E
LAKGKTLKFKVMLHRERKRRVRAPVWLFAKTGKRLYPRVSRRHWRETKLGHVVRRKLGIMK